MRLSGKRASTLCIVISVLCSGHVNAERIVHTAKKAASPAAKSAPIPAGLHYYTPPRRSLAHTLKTDVCVYGATSAGVVAAVQLHKSGLSVVLIEQGAHLGGMTSGGLSNTDIGNTEAIGGMSLEFYRDVGKQYGETEEWRFEPHVAERIYDDMINENHIPVYFREFIKSAAKVGSSLVSITMENGMTVEAKQFIDTSYEGDLMARAKVSYAIGREDNHQYHETINGTQVSVNHQFVRRVDPFVVEGDSSSPALPSVDETPLSAPGTGDKRIQAYNFRLCSTKRQTESRFQSRWGYDPKQYIMMQRLLATGWTEVLDTDDEIKGGKYDRNNNGPVSTDYIGMNYAFPDADYKTRETIYRKHLLYLMGLMWYLTNDSHVPVALRDEMREYGLCKDEFTDTEGWSPQLYIRESRRMISDYVMTEHNCRGIAVAPDSIGLAAYMMDSHNCRRYIDDGSVKNEGDVEKSDIPPYPISYRAIVPKRAECANLLVPVCLSSTHIAYGSIRMEPVFMILGQSAALAAALAIKHNCAVQDVPYAELRTELLAAHQVLEWKPAK